MISRLCDFVREAMFAAAFFLAGVAVAEKVLNLLGYTLTVLTALGGYPPARLLELAAVALLFAIALQIREIGQIARGGAPVATGPDR